MTRCIASLLLVMTTPAFAAEAKLSGDEILSSLNDVSLYAGDDNSTEQIFQKRGQTVYIDHGNASQGLWKVEDDRYCSQWPPTKFWTCYDVTRDGETITFISKTGERFPMRTHR